MSPLYSRSPYCQSSPRLAVPSITVGLIQSVRRYSLHSIPPALMIAKEAATDTSAQLTTNAQKYFLALFTRPEAKNITVNANYTTTGGTSLVINATADVPTGFLGVIGYNSITVGSSSTAKWGSNRLRVALVLDNTGSMADSGKITALISATNSLLTQLQNAASTNGDVYVSIVPFVKDSNLGCANWNSDYIYWGTVAQDPTLSDNNSWDANNGSCSSGNYSTRSSCVSHASCSISAYSSQSSCTGAGTCSWRATAARAPARPPAPVRFRARPARAAARARAPARMLPRRARAAAQARRLAPNRNTRRNQTAKTMAERGAMGRGPPAYGRLPRGRPASGARPPGHRITTIPGTAASWIAAIRPRRTR